MTNNWRALARMARDRIVTSSPRDVELVLNVRELRYKILKDYNSGSKRF